MIRSLAAWVVLFLANGTDAASSGLLLKQRQPAGGANAAAAMAGIEGEACDEEEYDRYKTIVCGVMSECKCSGIVCELEWCADFVHKWKGEFGACLLKGCGDEPAV